MTREKALLIPNPHGIELGVPTEVEVGPDGAAPEHLHYDGTRYRLTEGRGPEGQRLYEVLE